MWAPSPRVKRPCHPIVVALVALVVWMACPRLQAQTFDAGASYPLSSSVNKGPESIRAVDLNKDGHTDLITADNGFLSLYFGNGSGTFPATPETRVTELGNTMNTIAVDNNSDVALADIDGDTQPDLLVTHTRLDDFPRVLVFLNNPLGSFITSGTSITEAEGMMDLPSAIKLGNLNPLVDNHLDLVVTGSRDPRFKVYLGDGQGGFVQGYENNLITNSFGQNVDIGDFNEDGYNDLAVVDRLRVWLFFGDGLGGFPTNDFTVTDFSSGAHREWDVLMRDMDGDQNLDLVISNGGRLTLADTRTSIAVLFGDGSGSLDGELVSIDVGKEVARIAVADFDNDGHPDIVGAVPELTTDDGGVAYVRGLGNRQFEVVSELMMSAQGRGTFSVAVGDFDQNGRPDVALGNEGLFSGNQVTVAPNMVVYLNQLEAIPTPTVTVTPTPFPTLTRTPTQAPTNTPTITLTPTITNTPGPADINLDGLTNAEDLLILLEQQGNVQP